MTPAAGRTRPATVVIGGLLLFVVPMLALGFLVARIAGLGAIDAAFQEVYGRDYEDYASFALISSLVEPFIYLLIGLVLGLLAIFVMLGKNGARIGTWVVGGIGVCCGGAFLGLTSAGAVAQTMLTDDAVGPAAGDLERALEEHLPAWVTAVVWITSGLGVLVLALALILLALPPSNAYFRKVPGQQLFEPPSQYPPSQYPQQYPAAQHPQHPPQYPPSQYPQQPAPYPAPPYRAPTDGAGD